MTEQTGSDDDTLLSPTDMRLWLKVEVKGARLAAERRIAEAKTLVDDYVSGRLSREQANEKLDQHEARWGRGANDSPLGWEIADHALEDVLRKRQARQGRTGRGRQ